MARKLRLEFEGAVYHLINTPEAHKSRQRPHGSFLREWRTLAYLPWLSEAGEKAGWQEHAWCVMSNHDWEELLAAAGEKRTDLERERRDCGCPCAHA